MAADIGPLIVVVGPTASGKSAMAMDLLQRFNGEIICADARTVYKGMDIGTAKPSLADQAAVKHHLLDIRTPDERFTVVDFKQLAEEAITAVLSQGKIPIMVGGTGLYIDAVLFNYAFDAGAERSSINPRHAGAGSRGELRTNTLVLGPEIDKPKLDEKIEKRVHEMLEQGLETEVQNLVQQYGWEAPGLNAIGYREWRESKNPADEIIKNSRAYAKRQRSWFKRNKSIQWLNDPSESVEIATTFLNKTSK